LTIGRKIMFPALKGFLIEFLARILKRKKEEPPPVITAKPVEVVGIWGWSAGSRRKSIFSSIIAHFLILLFILVVFKPPVAVKTARGLVTLIMPVEIPPYAAKVPPGKGGGGGGDSSPLLPSKGRAPRPAPRQFTPPSATPPAQAKLLMEPTIIARPDAKIPNVDMSVWGDPLGKIGPPSSGPGSGGGIGTGSGGGVGPGEGPGFGPGKGGGIGGGVYRIGEGGTSAPQLIYKIEPEYSDEARKAKFQGTVVLTAVVDTDGMAKDIKVMRPLGLGLDEKAIEAIKKWRFRPGMKNGKPVAVLVTIEVNFRLL
jgi:TonB family protein